MDLKQRLVVSTMLWPGCNETGDVSSDGKGREEYDLLNCLNIEESLSWSLRLQLPTNGH